MTDDTATTTPTLRLIGAAGAACADGVCRTTRSTAPQPRTERRQEMTTATIDLETRFAITDLLHTYSTAIDTRDWALFRSIFTDDAHIDYGAAVGVFDNADAFTALMQQGHDPLGRTVHRVGNIVITPGDPIRVRSYGDNINLAADNTNGHHGAAYYDDDIVPTTNGYKIARRQLTMVLFEPVPTNLAAPAADPS